MASPVNPDRYPECVSLCQIIEELLGRHPLKIPSDGAAEVRLALEAE